MGFRTQNLRAATTKAIRRSSRATRLRDRFELLVPIGSGGFGTVWEGFDMLLERPVAIKEIAVDVSDSDASDALREARATARVNHPAVVSLYEIVSEPGRIYMISELVHGETLDELIDSQTMSDNDIGRIGYGLCEALRSAHAEGVVHRDVKPANVIVTQAWLDGADGWRSQPAKLMDFGIASILDGGEGGLGPHAGSRGYASPEQEAGEPASDASDVYSLALVLFECFSGSRPKAGRRARLSRVRSDLPPELTACIDRCLEIDPQLRPLIDELGAELSAALPELSDRLRGGGIFTRLSRMLSRSRESTLAPERTPPHRASARDYESSRVWRFGFAALAALMCGLTMVATTIPLSPLPPLLAAVLVFLLPRAGWSLAAVAGVIALAIEGQVGSAMFIALPAVVAAAAALVPLPRVIDGALAGAGAFAWVVAMQAISGTSLALSLPADIGDPADVRLYADVALDAANQFAQSAYTASLGLWALTGAVAVLLYDRFAGARVWGATLGIAVAAQVAIAGSLSHPTPWITLAAVMAASGVFVLLAFLVRRAGRVFRPHVDSVGRVANRPMTGRHERLRV